MSVTVANNKSNISNSSGIGRGVAIALANSGCHVFINFPPSEGSEPASEVQASIRQSGGTASLAPGATLTPILEDVPDDILDGIRQAIPRGKLAEVDDIVGTFIFLASDDAAHFRSQCLSPNGGDVFL